VLVVPATKQDNPVSMFWLKEIKMKNLIREYYELCPNGTCHDYLTEQQKLDVKENGTVYLSGIIQRADELNGNGRVYPKHLLEREYKNYLKLVEEKRACGQLDHPEDAVVELSKVSHIMERLWWDGNNLMGTARVLKHHPCGQMLEGLVKDGVQIGISSRGLGSVREENNKTIVEDDYQLICFDIVQEPSTTGAFLMKEHKENIKIEKSDLIFRKMNDILE